MKIGMLALGALVGLAACADPERWEDLFWDGTTQPLAEGAGGAGSTTASTSTTTTSAVVTSSGAGGDGGQGGSGGQERPECHDDSDCNLIGGQVEYTCEIRVCRAGACDLVGERTTGARCPSGGYCDRDARRCRPPATCHIEGVGDLSCFDVDRVESISFDSYGDVGLCRSYDQTGLAPCTPGSPCTVRVIHYTQRYTAEGFCVP